MRASATPLRCRAIIMLSWCHLDGRCGAVGADSALIRLDGMVAVHQRAGPAAVRARPRRGRAWRVGVSAKTMIGSGCGFTTALVKGPFDGSAAAWKDAERDAALIFLSRT